MSKSYETIEVSQQGKLGLIVLNRPKVLNAINRTMVSEILAAMEGFEADSTVKAIVLSGNGRAFAAGADIDEMANDHAIDFELRNQFKDWDRLAMIKKPIIGAVQGFALGGGFELALCCDLLYAADNAEFGFPEVNLGVMPGAGGTQRLTKLVGKTKAMEWLFTGKRISAREALHHGIVNQLIAEELLMEETMKAAEHISSQAPIAIRLIKEAVLKAVDTPLNEGMEFERKNFYLLFSTEDQKEGMNAFIEKRKPHFKGK
ncbi:MULTISPECIES: enoyl-CoA hydratase-related protein [Bacillaceae]|jgi:enoyl-CoA hydratase|uniref:Enoyl-CoA hydratase-related protein n=1 Tax=Cytobacillus firmus TaxID=1399 RepID=A0AA46PSG4_CYTFI|nr:MULTISPECIES: enoyl-CoA hydratase-related protein [Bacillaceae]KML40880.1 enoyl-CoA hydratase [Cytobacillus firmus]MBY6052692.1 enoyl-CoA hydratase/isomerase family protein [Cytobacillus firmus]MCC3646030.1 enoyl-CoA hydratase/isomerase family protein [Cytobacillus oceanisediminis]MCS0652632.1 enoyl-CoA hydratase-related protein [Cytobacillus firmus]URT72889.1 enoyl-CoA hydratase-related protein [Cytobacillus firmus]